MKRLILIFAILISFSEISESKTKGHINSYGHFYSQLAPHGVWMEFNDGLVVWRPTIMRRGWAPYSIGRWIWTDYGWYWDSYESFGHITYHYGRWYNDDYYGWIWIPDYDWAPAWVEWRYDDVYVGWAPLSPYAVFTINVGLHFTFSYVTPYHHWHFVNYNHLCDPHVYNHYVGPKYKYRIFSKTKYRNDYGYDNGRIINRGVDIGVVRSRSGQDIRPRNLQNVSDPRELPRTEKDRSLKRKSDVVKTYMPLREEISKDNIRNADVRKIERKSTLETSRLQIGDRRNNREADVRNSTEDSRSINRESNSREIEDEKKQKISNENRSLENPKRETSNSFDKKQNKEIIDVERKREENKPTIERKKNEVSIDKSKNRGSENNSSGKSQNEVSQERNTQIQRQHNDVKVERKIESDKNENRNFKQNDVQKNSDSRNTNQRTNQETRTSERSRKR